MKARRGREVSAVRLAQRGAVICGLCQGEPGEHRLIDGNVLCPTQTDDGLVVEGRWEPRQSRKAVTP
jgi:hypothetical protein